MSAKNWLCSRIVLHGVSLGFSCGRSVVAILCHRKTSEIESMPAFAFPVYPIERRESEATESACVHLKHRMRLKR